MSTRMHEVVTRRGAPAVSVLMAGVYLVTAWIGGHLLVGLMMSGLMLAFAIALIVAGARSETMRGIIEAGDERFSEINTRATATTGLVLVVAVLVGGVVRIAEGHSGAPYSYLAALGGFAYVAAVAWENQHR
jgi:uncharacterized membrane protein